MGAVHSTRVLTSKPPSLGVMSTKLHMDLHKPQNPQNYTIYHAYESESDSNPECCFARSRRQIYRSIRTKFGLASKKTAQALGIDTHGKLYTLAASKIGKPLFLIAAIVAGVLFEVFRVALCLVGFGIAMGFGPIWIPVALCCGVDL
ncbi:hypothetical protein QBC43DRAFT_293446 [Cladorrhinum sp. PSN259]|nr:hypothetical protein QBC43DRAFT_293446 [Cladorrhinum sp. PSN259]